MGNCKSLLEDWLDECGHELGYSMDFYPPMKKWDEIKINRIYRSEYGKRKNRKNYI
jgi:hypothetical protein